MREGLELLRGALDDVGIQPGSIQLMEAPGRRGSVGADGWGDGGWAGAGVQGPGAEGADGWGDGGWGGGGRGGGGRGGRGQVPKWVVSAMMSAAIELDGEIPPHEAGAGVQGPGAEGAGWARVSEATAMQWHNLQAQVDACSP